jgi:hypothetical protein
MLVRSHYNLTIRVPFYVSDGHHGTEMTGYCGHGERYWTRFNKGDKRIR